MAENHHKRHIVIGPWRPCIPKLPGKATRIGTPPRGAPSSERRESLRRLTALFSLVFKDPTIIWAGRPGRN